MTYKLRLKFLISLSKFTDTWWSKQLLVATVIDSACCSFNTHSLSSRMLGTYTTREAFSVDRVSNPVLVRSRWSRGPLPDLHVPLSDHSSRAYIVGGGRKACSCIRFYVRWSISRCHFDACLLCACHYSLPYRDRCYIVPD